MNHNHKEIYRYISKNFKREEMKDLRTYLDATIKITPVSDLTKEEIKKFIRNTFEITGDKKDTLTHPEIEFIIEETNFDITRYNLKNFLKSYGAKDWRNSAGRGLSGVKIRN